MPQKSKPPSRDPVSPPTPKLTRDPSIITPGSSEVMSQDPYPTGRNKPKTERTGKTEMKPIPVFNETDASERSPKSGFRKVKDFMYNRENKTFCGRTCFSWLQIIAYSIFYMMFLATYTQLLLFGALEFTKMQHENDEFNSLQYYDHEIGLSATPTSENSMPLIWYRVGEAKDYEGYIRALDKLLERHRYKRDLRSSLGPCGYAPYGYGDSPCVIVRINKQMKWAGKPLQKDSLKTQKAPEQVQKWIQSDSKKLWLHCDGDNSYDKEHIGNITYYPNPPGFDADVFPIKMDSPPPLIAFQISNFTVGLSLSVQCNLWYEQGDSSIDFVLYVVPKSKLMLKRDNRETKKSVINS